MIWAKAGGEVWWGRTVGEGTVGESERASERLRRVVGMWSRDGLFTGALAVFIVCILAILLDLIQHEFDANSIYVQR